LVRVTADDETQQLWAAATPRDEAVDRVLNAVPEGWSAKLVDERLKPREELTQTMTVGEVRELSNCQKPHGA
jgi:hypothetical protein